jgi:uncharacterized protein (TIGR03437 family)
LEEIIIAMRKSVLIMAALAPLAFAQTQQTVTYSYSGLPLPIYPDDWNVVSIIRILVPRSLTVTKVTASVQVQYSGVGDLNVFLFSANGTRTKLLERNCGGLQNIDTTFDDSAATRFEDTCPQAGSGTYRGNEPLSNSNGENAYGYWRLAVENSGSSKTGLFSGFSLTIIGTTLGPPFIGPNSIVSSTSFNGGAVAPGDLVSLFGVNLGPTPGVRADASTTLPTSLGQTTVTFDGVPAPLFFVSGGFVQAQAPTTLTTGGNTSIRVTSTAGNSSTVVLPAVSTNPGIFTVEAGGGGQAKAINQDGSQNGDGSILGSDKPVPRGSIIQLYASGLGPLSPAIPAGTPAPNSPLSNTTLAVTATIANQPATVTFAGAAPGLIGVYQVNVQVPLTAPSGSTRMVLSVGGNTSQNGVTIQIR